MQYTLKHHPEKDLDTLKKLREGLFTILIVIIIVGYIHYYIRARRDFGKKFSYSKFIFGTVHCFHHEYA
jgi:hypothetical protein